MVQNYETRINFQFLFLFKQIKKRWVWKYSERTQSYVRRRAERIGENSFFVDYQVLLSNKAIE